MANDTLKGGGATAAAAGAGERYDPDVHGPLPARFLAGCKGNMEEARRRWVLTAEWREAEGINTILDEPHPSFETIKPCFPQYIHGRARNGCFIYYERPGLADWVGLAQAGTVDALVRHYIYMMEYIYSYVETDPNGKLISVWDITNCSASNLAGDRLKMMRATMGLVAAHYPERSDRLFIINAPFWFAATWRVISPWIDPNTRRKINILGSSYKHELCGYLGPENVPLIFGGTDQTPLGESKEEVSLWKFVRNRNARAPSSIPIRTKNDASMERRVSLREYASGAKSTRAAVRDFQVSGSRRSRRTRRRASSHGHDGDYDEHDDEEDLEENEDEKDGSDISTDYESISDFGPGGDDMGLGFDGDEVYDDEYEDGNASDTSFLEQYGDSDDELEVYETEDDKCVAKGNRWGVNLGSSIGRDSAVGGFLAALGQGSFLSREQSNVIVVGRGGSLTDSAHALPPSVSLSPSSPKLPSPSPTHLEEKAGGARKESNSYAANSVASLEQTPRGSSDVESGGVELDLSVAELTKLMAKVDAACMVFARAEQMVSAKQSIVAQVRRKCDEVIGRRAGLSQQMLCLLENEMNLKISATKSLVSSSSSLSYSSDALPPALAAKNERHQISLSLTMQMKRISSEAEKLCRKEHEARKELAHREKELATAEGCAADALVKKRAVSDLMSAVLARRLQSAPATENCAARGKRSDT